ncbi:DUF1987 domain-containing protein [Bordetella sp. FB-8]|uniref:DUF1987 domain-containing protein n=1 Tax=Bordetella sp. FB-8 TaxID=1159870 RepID=UPI00037F8380|nr:DUF1987 domain-containing protein [Bordetella sp. FB-8]
MENLYIAATATSPEIDFRFDQNQLSITGESYPENSAAFYAPIIQSLNAYLALRENAEIVVNVALSYFNSSSTKMLFSIFEALDLAAQAGNTVLLNWYHDDEDETILEFGQELQADFTAIEISYCPVSAQ